MHKFCIQLIRIIKRQNQLFHKYVRLKGDEYKIHVEKYKLKCMVEYELS